MNKVSLPLDYSRWKIYFKKIYDAIEEVLPRVTYGYNKIVVFLSELEKFNKIWTETMHRSLKLIEITNSYEFVKACTALIAVILKYSKEKWLNYVLNQPLSLQYDEMKIIYSSFSYICSTMSIECFEDVSDLQYAHFLDLLSLQKIFGSLSDAEMKSCKNKINETLDKINRIINANNSVFQDQTTKGIVKHEDFKLSDEIGKGGMAIVYKAEYFPTGKTIAVKELRSVELTSRKVITMKRELNTLITIHHPNVSNILGITVTPPFSILMDYLPNGSLFDALRDRPEEFDATARMKIIIGLARGLEYLDAMHIVHRDFKSANVLLSDKNEAIICDFGLSRTIGPHMTKEIGTPNYMAPEVIEGTNGIYDSSVDTYAFGMTLYEILVGTIPHITLSNYQIAILVAKKGMRPDVPQGNDDYCALMKQCWAQNPRNRPKMSYVRAQLEECKANLDGTNVEELKKWIEETKEEHMNAVTAAIKHNEESDINTLKKIHDLNPLDPAATLTLQKLYQSEIHATKELFEDLMRLVDQQQSMYVAEMAGNILKILLNHEEISKVYSFDDLFDRLFSLSKIYPEFALDAIRTIADRFEDVYRILDKVIAFTESHFTFDVIDAVISCNVDKLDPLKIIEIIEKTEGNFSVALFRSVLNAFGPLDTFFEFSTTSPIFLSIYLSYLAKRCKTDAEGVSRLLGIDYSDRDDSSSDDSRELRRKLEEISMALTSMATEKISHESVNLVLTSLIPKCKPEVSSPLYALCAVAGYMDDATTDSDLWLSVLEGLNNEMMVISALDIITCVDSNPKTPYVQDVWMKLVNLFNNNRTQQLEDAIVSMCEKSHDFDVSELVPPLLNDFSNNINQTLHVLEAFEEEQLDQILVPAFWSAIIEAIRNCNDKSAKAIGNFILRTMSKKDIGIHPDFIAACLNFLYDENVTFYAAKPYLEIIGKLCINEDVLIFCARRHFGDYMNQLPWKYPEEPGIPFIMENFIDVLH